MLQLVVVNAWKICSNIHKTVLKETPKEGGRASSKFMAIDMDLNALQRCFIRNNVSINFVKVKLLSRHDASRNFYWDLPAKALAWHYLGRKSLWLQGARVTLSGRIFPFQITVSPNCGCKQMEFLYHKFWTINNFPAINRSPGTLLWRYLKKCRYSTRFSRNLECCWLVYVRIHPLEILTVGCSSECSIITTAVK